MQILSAPTKIEAVGDLRTNMIIAAALIEGVTLLGEIICVLIVVTK